MNKKLLLTIAILAISHICHGQGGTENGGKTLSSWNIKTNLIYDATTTFNLGAEFRLSNKTSLDVPISYNPWTFSDNKKWKHVLVQPEYRWWTHNTFSEHFFGLHGHYAFYNISGLNNPPFSKYMNAHRFEGWLAGAGISYGYRWNLSNRIGLETTLGVGYAYMNYDIFECNHCGEKLGSKSRNYIGPTKIAVNLIVNLGKVKYAPAPVVEPVYEVPEEPKEQETKVPYIPQYTVSYITPEVETIKRRSEAGKAYLDFVVGRSEIVSNFKNNAAELQKIHLKIEEVKDDPNAKITAITITGYASPEGTYASNMTLSEKRANALKNHIKAVYGFNEAMFLVSGRGEDWITLDSLVSQSQMMDKYRILEIIRGTDNYDARERKLAGLSGGHPYRQIKNELFPQLRRSDYELHYTVLPFTVEEGKKVLKTKPSSLSLNELFLIANTYNPGTDSFNRIFETAVALFPCNDVANLNAAASALARKNTVMAQKYLLQVSDKGHNGDYRNSMGILYGLQGDYEKAAFEFEMAKALGNMEATRNADETAKAKE